MDDISEFQPTEYCLSGRLYIGYQLKNNRSAKRTAYTLPYYGIRRTPFLCPPPVLSTFSPDKHKPLFQLPDTTRQTSYIQASWKPRHLTQSNTSASWLTRMPNLVELYAQHNALKTLPSNVHCPHLVCVNIRDNPISKIPSWLMHSSTSTLILSTENLGRQWIDELPEDSRKALVSTSLGKPFSAVQGFASISRKCTDYFMGGVCLFSDFNKVYEFS